MPEVGYAVPGIGRRPAKGLSAFFPNLARQAGGGYQSFKVAVTGSPGTQRVPVDAPYSSQSPAAVALAGQSSSAYSPDAIWPQQYYQRFITNAPGAGMPVQIYDPTSPALTTLLPVPATNLAPVLRSQSSLQARGQQANRVFQIPWLSRNYKAPTSG